jgi:hypothetical protein
MFKLQFNITIELSFSAVLNQSGSGGVGWSKDVSFLIFTDNRRRVEVELVIGQPEHEATKFVHREEIRVPNDETTKETEIIIIGRV